MVEYRGQEFIFVAGRRLGAGGMAEVYEAVRKDAPNVKAAVKVPLPHLDPEVKAMFLREADAARRVESPYVVRVLDWGDAPPFIAFEFMSGPTLDTDIARRRREAQLWAPGELLRMYLQLARGLESVNEHVVHRDLKPANIFVDREQLRVSDFGISKFSGAATRTRTFKGAGSPPYMAPETFRLEYVDWKADQYSLGVVFYEMATGARPFSGRSWEDFEQHHLYDPPLPATSLNPLLPSEIASIVSRMLSKRTGERFPSWSALEQQLEVAAAALPRYFD